MAVTRYSCKSFVIHLLRKLKLQIFSFFKNAFTPNTPSHVTCEGFQNTSASLYSCYYSSHWKLSYGWQKQETRKTLNQCTAIFISICPDLNPIQLHFQPCKFFYPGRMLKRCTWNIFLMEYLSLLRWSQGDLTDIF